MVEPLTLEQWWEAIGWFGREELADDKPLKLMSEKQMEEIMDSYKAYLDSVKVKTPSQSKKLTQEEKDKIRKLFNR